MVNKIYNLILVLLFALPVTAQTPLIKIDDVTAGPGTIEVPVDFNYFQEDVAAITLKIGFDDEVLTYLGLETSLQGVLGEAVGEELTITYINPQGVDINGQTLTLLFDYKGFNTTLVFNPGSELSKGNGNEFTGLTYVAGSVSLDPALVTGTTSLGVIDNVPVGSDIDMPVIMEGAGYQAVSAITLEVSYDALRLDYTGFRNASDDLTAGFLFVTNNDPGIVKITWVGSPADFSAAGTKLLDLVFSFKGGGNALLDFGTQSEIGDAEGDAIVTQYVSGAVNQSIPEGIEMAIMTVEAFPGETVVLPINALGLDEMALGAITLKIGYDPLKLAYINYDAGQLGPEQGLIVNPTGPGELTIAVLSAEGIVLDDGAVLSLRFNYRGGGVGDVVFMPGSDMSTVDGLYANIALVNGGVIPKKAGPDDGVATIGKINTLLDACETSMVYVPVSVTKLGNDVGAVTLDIAFNGQALSFSQIIFPENQLALKNAVLIESTASTVKVIGTFVAGLELDGTLFYIEFMYQGGTSPVRFLSGSSFSDVMGDDFPVAFVDGHVTAMDIDITVDAMYSDIQTVTGTPVVIPFTVTYPEVATVSPEIVVDARFSADGGFPAGATVTHISYNDIMLPVANGAIGGAEVVLLSEILGVAPSALAGHDLLSDQWVLTVSGIDNEVEALHVLVESIISKGNCLQVAGETDFHVSFADVSWQLDAPNPDHVCYDSMIEFGLNITYPAIINVDEDVKANAHISVSPALNAGAVIHWSYNGVASGEVTLSEETADFYLSEILDNLASLQSLQGTDMWSFIIKDVTPGDYEMMIVGMAQLDGTDYPYANLDPAVVEFTFWPEPAIVVGLGGSPLPAGATLEICYNVEVEVSLLEVLDGQGPFDIVWELENSALEEIITVTNEGVDAGSVLYAGTLPVGVNMWRIVSITDANGCEAANPSVDHNAEITVFPEPAIVAGLDGNPLPAGATLGICYDVEVEVSLLEVLDGKAPFDIVWELENSLLEDIIIVTNEGVDAGSVLYSGTLPVGVNHWRIVSITDANGCEAADPSADHNAVITVFAEPEAVIAADGPLEFCEGGAVVLTATESASYLWSNDETTQSITVSESGIFSVTVTDANGCSSTSDDVEVTINPLPVATITAGGPLEFCDGGSVVLTASNAASYLWSNNAVTPSITVTASGIYYVTVTDAKGCSATSDDVAVNVFELPVVTCRADTVVMLSHEPFALAGSTPAGGVYSGVGVTTAGMFEASVAQPGIHVITYTVTSADGCVVACTFNIEVKLDTSVPKDAAQSTIRLYPNPARDILNIVSSDDIREIRMVDMLGQVVFTAGVQYSTYELNVSSFKNGIYFVQVLTEKGFTTHRVQVTR